MTTETSILITTAVSVGCLHTLLGPDHYVPFVAMARTNCWSMRHTVAVTVLCGIGHVLGSVAIGAVGLAIGTMVFQIEAIESFRGETAAWLLIGFGLAYLTWGIVQAIRDVPHTHLHQHADGTVHSHPHRHDPEHQHVHRGVGVESEAAEDRSGWAARLGLTPWVLFVIFVFGPCEVLIPLLMYPAAQANGWAVVAVVAAFAVATIGTMTAMVLLIVYGLNALRLPDFHRFSHPIAGGAVLLCGLAIKFGL